MAEQEPVKSPPSATEGCTAAQVETLALYLKCTRECMVGVQKLPSPKFYNKQCEYLVEKLEKFVPAAGVVLRRLGSSVDAERHIEVLKLALALAKQIESFVKRCGDDSIIQAAMASTYMSRNVASIGFDLELCEIALCKGGAATTGCIARLTLDQVQAKYEAEVKEVEKKVSEDVEALFNKVLYQLPEKSLKNEKYLMASFLLQRLNRMKPTSASIPSESRLYSVIDDPGILGAMYKLVRPGKRIGSGASATVYKAKWLGMQVAKKRFQGTNNPDFKREVNILARLSHPNITSMFCCEKGLRSSSLIMEIMDGDLHALMDERCGAEHNDFPPFTIFEAVDIILQIGEGVNYLHSEGICHRDLKSLNILVKSVLTSQSEIEVKYVHAKVADFGLSKTKNSTTFRDPTLNTGTCRWMAPEIIALGGRSKGNTSSQPKYPLKVDVHSFAMLCYEILTGYVPFHEADPRKTKEKIKSGIRPELPNNCPPELKALIEECWDKIPSKRPSFPVICSRLKYVKYLLMTGFCSNEDTQASTSVESEAAKPKVFVSFSVSEEAFAEQLSTDLRSAMNHFDMFDEEVTKGENYGTIIRDATKDCKVAVFVLSGAFFASKWQMLELVEFVRAAKDSNNSLRLIPLFYKVSPKEVFDRMELWRPRWDEFAQYDSRLGPEECDSCVRSLTTYYGPRIWDFGRSEMNYRDAIVKGIASYDGDCEEAWPKSPPCAQCPEEISYSEQGHGYQIVLSYSGYQLPFVEQLDKELAMRNLSVFFAPRSLPHGKPFASIIFGAVESCQVAVLILSGDYLNSKWPMIELHQAVGRLQRNDSILILPLFYELSVNDLSEESIRQQWRPRWEEISKDDPRVDPERWVDAVRVLRTMEVLRLEDFKNRSEVKCRDAIVEEIVQFLATRASVKKLSETPSLDGEGQSSV